MVQLTRLNGEPLIVNSDLIESIECRPDTTISLTTGQKILVLESPTDIIRRVVRFRRSLLRKPGPRQGKDKVSRDLTHLHESLSEVSLTS